MKEYKGTWFTPSNPDLKMAGILKVDKKNSIIELKLYSDRRPDGSEFDRDPSYRVVASQLILGEIHSIERTVTLFSYDGGFLEKPIGIDLREYTYHAGLAFFGHLFYSKNEIKFKALTFRLSHFDSWFGGLAHWDEKSDFQEPKLFTDKKMLIPLADGTLIKFERHLMRVRKGNSITSKTDSTVTIEFEDKRSFWEHLNSIYKIEHFLHFSIGEPITILDCKSDKNDFFDVPSTHWNYQKTKSLTRSFMAFNPNDFDENYLIDKVKNWIIIHDQFSPCLNTFRYAVNPIWKSGSKSLEYTEFTNATLNIAQALEGFYKIDRNISFEEEAEVRCNNQERLTEVFKKIKNQKQNIGLTNEDFNFIVSEVLNRVPKSKSSNIKFREIISDHCKSQQDAVSDFINPEKIEQFSKDLTKVRNTLTHIDDKNIGDISTRYESVFDLFNCSQALFYSLTMDEVGFSQSEIKEMLTKLKTFM